jgi:methanogenic corrinoid protein MtbC1
MIFTICHIRLNDNLLSHDWQAVSFRSSFWVELENQSLSQTANILYNVISRRKIMHPLFAQFSQYLEKPDKAACVRFVIDSLQGNKIDIVTLYNDILSPALTQPVCLSTQKEICIWEEHVRTSIVRTVIENCFPFVTKERDQTYHSPERGKVIVVCPTEELHEIGARMAVDFFTLCGFDVTFIGANTPQDEIVEAIKYIKPIYVAISITNYYNLVAARHAVERICEQKGTLNFKLILGGLACLYHPDACREMGADLLLQTFNDIRQLGGQTNAST